MRLLKIVDFQIYHKRWEVFPPLFWTNLSGMSCQNFNHSFDWHLRLRLW